MKTYICDMCCDRVCVCTVKDGQSVPPCNCTLDGGKSYFRKVSENDTENENEKAN